MDLQILSTSMAGWRVVMPELDEDRLVWEQDGFEAGPLTADLAAFRALRADWARAIEPGWVTQARQRRPERPRVVWDERLDALLEGIDRVCIWLTTHLRRQLALAYVVARLDATGVPWTRVDVIPLGGRRAGIAEQHAAGLPLPRRPLTEREWQDALALWHAVTSPTPDALLTWLDAPSTSEVPSRDSIRLLLNQHPDCRSGLSVHELRLLQETAEYLEGRDIDRIKSACVLGEVLFGEPRCEDDQQSENVIFARALALGDPALPRPVLEIHGDTSRMATTWFGITDFGREVLAGRASFLDHNPIDRQVAGVHLNSAAGQVWLRDGDTLVPA